MWRHLPAATILTFAILLLVIYWKTGEQDCAKVIIVMTAQLSDNSTWLKYVGYCGIFGSENRRMLLKTFKHVRMLPQTTLFIYPCHAFHSFFSKPSAELQ